MKWERKLKKIAMTNSMNFLTLFSSLFYHPSFTPKLITTRVIIHSFISRAINWIRLFLDYTKLKRIRNYLRLVIVSAVDSDYFNFYNYCAGQNSTSFIARCDFVNSIRVRVTTSSTKNNNKLSCWISRTLTQLDKHLTNNCLPDPNCM